ncbi:MAG TPA: LLM class flavin-dependent oxidoreductase [Jatrophihabitantaceae bacterium]|nr:LLM class flavin-dependent oxidoreductase [Jatrophihabitantaceae bacterium]
MTGVAEPSLVVLIGASGSGKSTWAQTHYRDVEIVSSDDLRGVVGSGRHDLDATADAFRLLDDIVDARLRRSLTCVIDTLGLDAARRRGYLDCANRHGIPAFAVVLDTPPALVRSRNASRDRPMPAPALAAQLKRSRDIRRELEQEGWHEIIVVPATTAAEPRPAAPVRPPGSDGAAGGLQFILQVSRFPWGDDPLRWLKEVALAADDVGFSGLALMDHLIQIPQVGRAWEPIPEPWVTLGMLAGLGTDLRLGTLVSPVTFRPAGITAKAVATLDAISGGRAFLGVGAGWWEREHAAFGLPFPPAADRLDALEAGIETIRALLAPGTKAYRGAHIDLPETTCYPRPNARVPIIVGGSGARTLRIAATLADGCNVSSGGKLTARIALLRQYCAEVGRDPAEVAITVLDLPVAGVDREQVWGRVERMRGRTAAATYARMHHAGTYPEQRDRYARMAEQGVGTVFLALGQLAGAEDITELAPMLRGMG